MNRIKLKEKEMAQIKIQNLKEFATQLKHLKLGEVFECDIEGNIYKMSIMGIGSEEQVVDSEFEAIADKLIEKNLKSLKMLAQS